MQQSITCPLIWPTLSLCWRIFVKPAHFSSSLRRQVHVSMTLLHSVSQGVVTISSADGHCFHNCARAAITLSRAIYSTLPFIFPECHKIGRSASRSAAAPILTAADGAFATQQQPSALASEAAHVFLPQLVFSSCSCCSTSVISYVHCSASHTPFNLCPPSSSKAALMAVNISCSCSGSQNTLDWTCSICLATSNVLPSANMGSVT